VVAHDGLEGLELLKEAHPDLIILGGHMLRMDGWEFLSRYREQIGPHVPTLSVSVSGRPLPADAVLPQPFDLDTFLGLVRRYAGVGERESGEG
jgi:CheY-like chemotaxis protein